MHISMTSVCMSLAVVDSALVAGSRSRSGSTSKRDR